jgi:hypothetical protein
MIRKLKSGQYRLYSRKTDPRTGRRRNLGTFGSRAAAEKHERAVQYFKRHYSILRASTSRLPTWLAAETTPSFSMRSISAAARL